MIFNWPNRLDNLDGFRTLDECISVYNDIVTEYSDQYGFWRLPRFTKGTAFGMRQGEDGSKSSMVGNGARIRRVDLTTNRTVGIREYLSAGRRVATNLDLNLDCMFSLNKATAIRLPDKPRPQDMEALGEGYQSDDPRDYDEKRFGLIVLDECGTWLNTREWNDKERRKLIDWFLHARKLRWDVMFLIQDVESCDAQIVRSLCEHLVICRRLDRFKLMGIHLPRLHIANVYYGRSTEVHVEKWMYRGGDLFNAYDTRQVFRDEVLFTDAGPVDMRAPYSMLSAWHLKGRYLEPEKPKPSLKLRIAGFLLFPLIVGWMFVDPTSCKRHCFRPGTFPRSKDEPETGPGRLVGQNEAAV